MKQVGMIYVWIKVTCFDFFISVFQLKAKWQQILEAKSSVLIFMFKVLIK